MSEPLTTDPSDCPICGEWRDAPDADCANCGYHVHDATEAADKGGAMETTCRICGIAIWRQGYGSFVGPWLAALSKEEK